MRNPRRNLIIQATKPTNRRQWFLRRVYLEGRLDDFIALRRQLIKSGVAKDFLNSFWPAARSEYFGFSSVDEEKKKCKRLERRERKQQKTGGEILMEAEVKKNEKFTYDEDVSYYDSVKWAFENWPKYIKQRGDESIIVNEGQMRKEAPSLGAVGLIEYARQSLDKFQVIAARVLAKTATEAGGDPDKEIVCDDGVDDLKRVLQSLEGD